MLILRHIATLGFIGYIPFAPGTYGSLAAFAFYVFLKPNTFFHILMLCLLIPIGVISSHYAERSFDVKDSRHIIIDEFCGYLFSVILLPFSYTGALIAFFLFRFFDILKPFPIKKIESTLSGGKGIMADDIMAAIYTNVILQIWRFIY